MPVICDDHAWQCTVNAPSKLSRLETTIAQNIEVALNAGNNAQSDQAKDPRHHSPPQGLAGSALRITSPCEIRPPAPNLRRMFLCMSGVRNSWKSASTCNSASLSPTISPSQWALKSECENENVWDLPRTSVGTSDTSRRRWRSLPSAATRRSRIALFSFPCTSTCARSHCRC